ncbi:Gfo/Idh/MocA family protein [Deinococcus yavapaiensis]|uniref:Putative dehydrogenase n=1 Tax=Deinococcus yavapaiensis KR-236 TaxID=694435 RepID=A0A318SIK1_9DEIO|nr:Gfo/Idh/MocA family oxidoreductase [Deinococcus yavapaiensis]PYE51202.1 putative dehydrogenase [Deinococcus yavapaiensis KR-236]
MRSAPQRPTTATSARGAARDASKPLRLVQVGGGDERREWLRQSHHDVHWVGRVAPEESDAALEGVADLPPRFDSLEDALANVKADGVLVTSEPSRRATDVREALDAGLHVLVEKPFARTIDEAHELVHVARARTLILAVNQYYRFAPAPRLASRLVRDASLGAVGAVHVTFRSDRGRSLAPGQEATLAPHPLLFDMAAHHFDLMCLVLGRSPLEVACRVWNPSWSPYLEAANASASVLFEGGTVVTYEGTLVTSAPPTALGGEWRLECEFGEVYFTSRGDRSRGSADRLIVRSIGGRARIVPLPRLTHADRAGVLAGFTNAVRGGAEAETSATNNFASLALCLGAAHSAATGTSVVLSDFVGRTNPRNSEAR